MAALSTTAKSFPHCFMTGQVGGFGRHAFDLWVDDMQVDGVDVIFAVEWQYWAATAARPSRSTSSRRGLLLATAAAPPAWAAAIASRPWHTAPAPAADR